MTSRYAAFGFLSLVLLVTFVAACTMQPVTGTASAEPTPVRMVAVGRALDMHDKFFLSNVRRNAPTIGAHTDGLVVGMAESSCAALDADADFDVEVEFYVENGYPSDEAPWFVSDAIAIYCPQHFGLLKGR